MTDVATLTVAETPDRAWYLGVYDTTDQSGKTALLISSKYTRTDRDDTDDIST